MVFGSEWSQIGPKLRFSRLSPPARLGHELTFTEARPWQRWQQARRPTRSYLYMLEWVAVELQALAESAKSIILVEI